MKTEKFYIDKTEISLKESWFEVSGWYIPKHEDDVEFVFLKNGEEISVRNNVTDRPDVLNVHKDAKSVVGFQIFVDDVHPRDTKSLKLQIKDGDKINTIFAWNEEDIKKALESGYLQFCVDRYEYNEKRAEYVVSGWAVSNVPNVEMKVSVSTTAGEDIPCYYRAEARRDLLALGIVDADHVKSGFYITYPQFYKNAILKLSLEGMNYTQSVDLEALKRANKKASIKRAIKGLLTKDGFIRFITGQKEEETIGSNLDKYNEWFLKHRVTESELEEQRAHVFEYQPKISILVPTYKTPVPMLCEMIESVRNQSYGNWELCIADGTMAEGELKDTLDNYVANDDRIKVRYLDENVGISGNTNKALEIATGDFIALLDHDDTLELDALYEVVKVLQDRDVDMLYTDEDKVSEDLTEYLDPNFKPDFSVDLLRSHNYITHFLVMKKTLLDSVGPFDSRFDGAQDYDLILRCSEKANKIEHVAKILYHWRMCVGSTADDPRSKMYCYEAGRTALEEHLKRVGVKGRVEFAGEDLWGLYHVIYDVVDNPMVSIVIANKDHTEDLDKAITSIQEKSTYRNFEFIVVENNSTEEETFTYYEKVQQKYDNVKVVYWDREFNYSAINNYGVTFAQGEYILLLNNDTEMITPTAIEEMLGICSRPDVGIVGAKLLYDDNTIQHAGVVIGFSGYAGHIFHGNGRYDLGYMMRACINCNYSAVTAACLMTKKSVFEEVGGLTEIFVVAGNDVDYCLKVREKDLLVVYNAYAEWYHYESKSRGYEDTPEKKERFDAEVEKFQERWGDLLDNNDPYYNKNFPVTLPPFTLEM